MPSGPNAMATGSLTSGSAATKSTTIFGPTRRVASDCCGESGLVPPSFVASVGEANFGNCAITSVTMGSSRPGLNAVGTS